MEMSEILNTRMLMKCGDVVISGISNQEILLAG